MKTKKTALEIEKEILNSLEKGPKTITDLKLEINSNWQTVEKFLKKLEEEKKVKEVVSTDKKKIYQRIIGDTYFDIPISDEERKKFRTLFYIIKKEYSNQGKDILKTHLAKTAVHVINGSKSSELSNLPTIWYLYGMIPLMVVDPMQEYLEEFQFKDKEKIIVLVRDYIKKIEGASCKKIQINQHLDSKEDLYIIHDSIEDIIFKKWDEEKLLEELNEFYVACPIDREFPNVFNFTDKFISIINKLSLIGKLEAAKKEISSTFRSLWEYIATYKAYKSLAGLNKFDNEKIILNFSIGSLLITREICFHESFQELYEIYWSNLNKNISFKDSKEVSQIKEIMQDWMGED